MCWINFITILFLLSGCSANWHLRQAKRHLKIAEQKGAEVRFDTVYVDRIVTTPEVRTDTVFQSVQGDTVVIQKEKLKIKYVKMPGDSVYIEGKCDPDTVKISVPVKVTTEIKAESRWKWWHLLVAGVVGVLACRLLWR